MYLRVEYSLDELKDDDKKEKQPWTYLAKRLLYREMNHWNQNSVQIGDAGAVAALIAMIRGNYTVDSQISQQKETASIMNGLIGVNPENGVEQLQEHPIDVKLAAYHVCVELKGHYTRGMTVVDHRKFVSPPDKAKEPENTWVRLIQLHFVCKIV